MLLQLIKYRSFFSGTHCQLIEVNHLNGNRILADIFVLNELMPAELIYPLSVTQRGITIRGKHCGWQWYDSRDELHITNFLLAVQEIHEEIFIEVSSPEPCLPGYPRTDYHPVDYPVILTEND